jgi:sugar phosphate isomerase/epimerase
MNLTMTRRAFSAGMAFSAAAAAAGCGTFTGPRHRMKFGCGTVVFRTLPLEEAMRRIRRAGFEYCETQAVGPWCPHVTLGKDDPEKFAALVKGFGFKGVTGLWSSHGAIIPDPQSVEGVCETIRWAKAAGIPVVHAGDGHKPDEMPEPDALKLLGERLAKILEVAEANQVTLAIEPHGTFSLTAEGLRQIMGLSPSKCLRINYDTANVHKANYAKDIPGAYTWNLYGRRRGEVETLKAIADHVVHVHVKDVKRGNCVALGQGEVDFKGCFDVLKAQGYTGVLSLETEGDQDADTAQRLADESYKFLTSLYA